MNYTRNYIKVIRYYSSNRKFMNNLSTFINTFVSVGADEKCLIEHSKRRHGPEIKLVRYEEHTSKLIYEMQLKRVYI